MHKSKEARNTKFQLIIGIMKAEEREKKKICPFSKQQKSLREIPFDRMFIFMVELFFIFSSP
jgi:hypothetical protein